MKKTKLLKVLTAGAALSLILTGCSSGGTTKKSGAKPAVEFKTAVTNDGDVLKDQTLKIGLATQAPITGMFNPVFYLEAIDYSVIAVANGNTLSSDDMFRFKQNDKDAAMMLSMDKDAKTLTFTIHEGLTWSNGEKVTADDLVATYHLMGHPKYTENIRYGDEYEAIKGMKDYHDGKADTISGVEKKDDRTVVVTYDKLSPSVLFGEGVISAILNKKQVEEASKDFTKFVEADLNTKPLSYGPYVIDKVVTGESVLLKANPHYFKKDEVKIPQVEIKRIPIAQASAALKAGEVDLMEDLTADIWEGTKDLKNGDILGRPARYLSYVGFKLGKFDKEKGEIAIDPNSKFADVRVRQAFGYAVDWDTLNKTFYKGLRFTPTGSGFYPPVVDYIYDSEAEGFKYDPEKAKKLLDEAGFKDVDGDGIREGKDGKPISFNFAIRDVGQTFDKDLAESFLKYWKEVGLDVKLNDGKLMASKDFSQRVQSDDPSIELFQGAWGLGTNPNPSALVGKRSQLNWQRFTTDEILKDVDEINSDEMFDDAKMKEAYRKFDKDFAAARPWLPFSWNTDMVWVNKRVKSFDYNKWALGDLKPHQLELTATEPKK